MKTLFFPRTLGAGLFFALVAALSAQPTPPDPSRVGPRRDDDRFFDRTEGGRVQAMSSNRVEADEKIRGDLRAVMGSNTVEGSVSHDVVAVMGSDTIDGSVGHDVIANMGSVIVNGTVGHNVKAVMGDVTLGPNSIVRGDVISIGGTIHREPGAIVRGRILSQSFNPRADWRPNFGWNRDNGRSDWMGGAHDFLLAWRWIFIVGFLGLYALVALVFPGPVRRCGDVLAERPLMTVLVAFASLLAVPLVFLLLLITIIGIPVAVLFLPCAILLGALFGKAGLYELIGRSLTSGRLTSAGAVLLGGVICCAFYFVPFLGVVIAIFLSLLGLGCAVTALLTASRRESPLVPPPAEPAPAGPVPVPAAAMASAPEAAFPTPAPLAPAAAPDPAPSPAAGAPVPVVPVAPVLLTALPRAGFWIRMGALFIDSMIVSVACGSLYAPNEFLHTAGFHLTGMNCLLPLAIYGALMWKFKGTTIGGMICGLRVVRLDGQPVEWETAIVRALACFLSTLLWLGFIWIAFDAEKQSWHDKIAGTAVVRTKGVSLV